MTEAAFTNLHCCDRFPRDTTDYALDVIPLHHSSTYMTYETSILPLESTSRNQKSRNIVTALVGE
jgi:hypothetical protein